MPDDWQPGFHDPSVIAWLITIGYLVAAIFAFILGKRYRPDKTAVVWFSLGTGLLFLCLNKQLDLQTWLGLTARDFTREHGLYQFKHLIRYGFMIALVAVASIPLVVFLFHIWALLSRAPLGTTGLALIGAFILIRGTKYYGPRFPYEDQVIIEAVGLALVLCSFGNRVFSRLPRPESGERST